MPNLQDLERPIDEAIANAIVDAIPESWNAAELEVTHSDDGFGHVITNAEGHRDMVLASERIFEATFRLHELFATFGKPWKKVVYKVRRTVDKSWGYSAEYTY